MTLMLALLIPLSAEAQRGRAAQIVKIRVRTNETVAILAERYGIAAEEIARLNNIEADAQLQPGMEIRMPSSTSPPSFLRRTSLASGIDADTSARAALYEQHIAAAARRYGVDPHVLWAIAFLETRFQPRQVSPKGAQGMMQFMPATAATYGLANPFDAVAAIDAAARYVRDLSNRFNNRSDLVLASYNAGEGAVDAFLRGVSLRTPDGRIINPRRLQTGGVPPYAETQGYVARGLQIMRAIEQANVFVPVELAAGQPLVAPFPQAASYVRRTALIANPPTPALPASAAQAIAPQTERVPASRYAVSVAPMRRAGSEDAPKSEDSEQRDATQTGTTTRSFRASATTTTTSVNEQGERGESIERTAQQPRSVRASVQAAQR